MVGSVKFSNIDEAIEAYLNGSTVDEARKVTTPHIHTHGFYKALSDRGITPRGKVSRREEVPTGALLTCKNCNKEAPTTKFSKHTGTQNGYDTSRCKKCKRSAMEWAAIPIEKRILNRTKARAKRKSFEFNLELCDIVVPERCPVFDIPFVYGDHMLTPSVDRIDSSKGYIKGNIVIISNKANMMKSSANLEDVSKLYEWMKKL